MVCYISNKALHTGYIHHHIHTLRQTQCLAYISVIMRKTRPIWLLHGLNHAPAMHHVWSTPTHSSFSYILHTIHYTDPLLVVISVDMTLPGPSIGLA